jgi:thiol-disulfide isomerase/thioredoxin
MSHKKRLAQIALAVLCLVRPAVLTAAVTDTGQRKPAPDFRLSAAGRRAVQLSKYKDKVVLLNFWATTSGGCKLKIPWFLEFQNRYERRGFVVIGVEKRIAYPIRQRRTGPALRRSRSVAHDVAD